MSCRCAIRFLKFYFHPWNQKKRVEKWCFFSETCNLNNLIMYIFQGIVNKWYARMWLDSTCRYPIRFKIFFYIHLHNLTQSYFSILLLSPLKGRCDPSFQNVGTPFNSHQCIFSIWQISPSGKMKDP